MKNLGLFTFVLFTHFCFAQFSNTSGGPDSYGYSFKTSAHVSGPSYSWIDITSTGTNITAGLADDNFVGPFNIGFNFPFYWAEVSSFYVGSNGYISFENSYTISSGGDPAFPTMPTSGGPDNFIAPLLTDLNFTEDIGGTTNPAQAYMYTNSVDTCIISFINVPFWHNNVDGWQGSNTFQIILSAADSSITFNYQNQTGSWNAGYDGNSAASVTGIEAVGSLSGLTVGASELPSSLSTVRFDLAVSPVFSLTDLSADWNMGAKNGGFFVAPQFPRTIQSKISNIGTNDVTNSFNVSTEIEELSSGNNATVYNNSINGLVAGATQSISHSPSLILQNFNCGGACDAGSYSVNTTIGFTDDNNFNNTISTEMVVLDESNPSNVEYSYNDNISDGQFGFEGGGIYIEPARYPADLTSIMYELLAASTPSTGFTAKVFSNDGVNGTPGTLLFSQTVPGASVIFNTTEGNNNFHTITLPTPVTITSGGLYISFEGGANQEVFLASDYTAPFSNQNYEVLSGVFGTYRSNDTEDLMIKATFDMGTSCTVNSSTTSDLCLGDSIIFGNTVIKNAGTFFETFSSANCDTIVELTVTQILPVNSSISGSFCNGGSYNFNGTSLSSAGVYSDTLYGGASNGCDSIIALTLTEKTVDLSLQYVDGVISSLATNAMYQWIDCSNNSNIANATSSSFTPTVSGFYAVKVTQNGCTSTTNCIEVTIGGGPGAIDARNSSAIKVYPNPANSEIFVELNTNLKDEHLVIFNTVGKEVMKHKITSKSNKIDISSLEKGLYILKISNSTKALIVN